jgi:hypothetical protein
LQIVELVDEVVCPVASCEERGEEPLTPQGQKAFAAVLQLVSDYAQLITKQLKGNDLQAWDHKD